MPACLDAYDEIIPCWAFELFLTSGSLYICYISLRYLYGLYPYLKSNPNILCKAKGRTCGIRMKRSFAHIPQGATFRNAVDSVARKVVIYDNNKGYGYREYIEEPPVLAGSYKFKCSIGRIVISRRSERKHVTQNILNLNIKESCEHLGWSLSGSRVGTMSPQQHDTGDDTGDDTATVTEGTWILEGHVNEEGDAYWVESQPQQLRSDKDVAKEVLVHGKFTTPTQFHGEWLSSTDGSRGNYTDFVSFPLTSNEEQMDRTSTEVCVVGIPIQTC